jgi:hypothetical protein
MVSWARAELLAGRRPALIVASTLRALDVVARLAAEGVAVSATRPIRDAARAVRDLTTLPVLASPGAAPTAVVARIADVPALLRARPHRTALVSGRVRTDHLGFDTGFAWSGAADRGQLLGWLETTGARQIYLSGAGAESIAAHLGPRARVLGPPRQMTLFPGGG